MPRRAQFQRTLRVLRLLASTRGATLQELASEVGACERTVRRDLHALEAAGLPVYDDDSERPKRWFVQREYRTEGRLAFAPDELLSLHAAAQALPEGLSESMESAYRKIRSVSDRPLLDRLDASTGIDGAGRQRARPVGRQPDRLLELVQAVDGSRELELDYRSRSERGRALRKVEPLGFVFRASGGYLLARPAGATEVRKYKLSRIESSRPTGRGFTAPNDFDPAAQLLDSFGVHGGPTTRVVIRFTPAAASYVRERCWHPSQALEDAPDGSLVLTLEVGGLVELRSWVQSFGADAEVLEPARLAADVARDAARVHSRWRRRVPGAAAMSGPRSR